MNIRPVRAELFRADRWTVGRQTDTTKLIVAFHNFANAPKNCPKERVMWRIFSRLKTSVAALAETHQHNRQKQHARRNMQQVSLSSRPLFVVAGNITKKNCQETVARRVY
jgi:hypothetical protein